MPDTDNQPSVLIIDDNEDVLLLLSSMLKKEGYRTLSATTGKDGIDLAREEEPSLVLLDLNMPDLQGLEVCRNLKTDPKTQDSVVMILSAITDIQVKARGFHLGAVDYIHKPFRHVELLARIQAQLRLKKEYDELKREYREIQEKLALGFSIGNDIVDQTCVLEEKKRLRFQGDVGKVQGVVNQLLIGIGSRLNSKLRMDLALGLHEMVLNAIEHGNLGIDCEEKRKALELNRFNELLRSKQADPELAGRGVVIEYEFQDNTVTYRIRDEGDGFDWKPYVERNEPEDLLASNGRGIMMSRYIFDSLEYNDIGNEVVLEKRIF